MDVENNSMPDVFYGFGDETPIPGRLIIITEGEADNEEVIKVIRAAPDVTSVTDSKINVDLENNGMPDMFYGFGNETPIPGRLKIITEGEGDEEEVIKVIRYKRMGRPKGTTEESGLNVASILEESSRHQFVWAATSPVYPGKAAHKPATPKVPLGTSSRLEVFLLGKLSTNLSVSKLPKTRSVLNCFLFHLGTGLGKKEATQKTLESLKESWQHHFGIRVIFGKDFENDNVDENKKIISTDKYICEKIVSLHNEYTNLEQTSRRPDRAKTSAFLNKVDRFVNNVLDMPFNITRKDFENVLQDKSGIRDWKEDIEHLKRQMEKDQPSSCDSLDLKQQKKDDRKLIECISAKKTAQKNHDQNEELRKRRLSWEEANNNENSVPDMENDDDDFVIEGNTKKRRKLIDVMGPVSLTADRIGLSVRDRTMIAASVVNAIPGLDVYNTNINKSTAWRKGQSSRIAKSKNIKEEFEVPDRVVVHWDGKLLKLKGNIKSNRVAVYLTGVNAENVRKLLGVPDCPDGSGASEFGVVKVLLIDWEVFQQVVGMVFDTTATNSGAEAGACRFLELWCGKPILWLPCRHHITELHISHAMKINFGKTTDPGVALFRRLKADWSNVVTHIVYSDLCLIDMTSFPEWMVIEGSTVLDLLLKLQEKKSFPRDDYQELLQLAIINLGGDVPNFAFRLPGPDHHARWMSKAIYILKLHLLSKIFKMSEEEFKCVEKMTVFIAFFYVKVWFESTFAVSAGRNDLQFIGNMLRYRQQNSQLAFTVLESCKRHLWYLSPQLIVLALCDEGLQDFQREDLAKALHSQVRQKIELGKPEFPGVDWSGEEIMLPALSSFVSHKSWLVFDILNLNGTQDWLTVPASLWDNFSEYRDLKEFASNLTVKNDIAERGIAMVTEFVNKVESEEQRNALLQVVEWHHSLVKDTTKSSLSLC